MSVAYDNKGSTAPNEQQPQQYPPEQYPPQQYPPPYQQQGFVIQPQQQYLPAQQGYPPPQGYPLPQQQSSSNSNSNANVNVNVVGPSVQAAPPMLIMQQQTQQLGPAPDDYCTYSILNTIFCCFWIGIFAILKSQATRDAVMRGDMNGANQSSKEALRLNKIALGIGIAENVVFTTIIIIYYAVIAVAVNRYSYYY